MECLWNGINIRNGFRETEGERRGVKEGGAGEIEMDEREGRNEGKKDKVRKLKRKN